MSGTIARPMLSCRAKGQRDSLSACDPDCFLMPRMRRARSVHLPHMLLGMGSDLPPFVITLINYDFSLPPRCP